MAKTFHQFGQLPLELQSLIWHMPLPTPIGSGTLFVWRPKKWYSVEDGNSHRVIYDCSALNSLPTELPLISVNRESRSIAQSYIQRHWLTQRADTHQDSDLYRYDVPAEALFSRRINPRIDYLYFPHSTFTRIYPDMVYGREQLRYSGDPKVPPLNSSVVTRIAIDHSALMLEHHKTDTIEFFQKITHVFDKVKEVLLIIEIVRNDEATHNMWCSQKKGSSAASYPNALFQILYLESATEHLERGLQKVGIEAVLEQNIQLRFGKAIQAGPEFYCRGDL